MFNYAKEWLSSSELLEGSTEQSCYWQGLSDSCDYITSDLGEVMWTSGFPV